MKRRDSYEGQRLGWLIGACVLMLACGGDGGPHPDEEAASADASAAVHTFDLTALAEVHDASGASMGSVAFPVSCSDEAVASMRLGLALLHNMTYVEAAEVFERAAEQDPTCGLAHWGIAMTYLHPLWPDVPSNESFAWAGAHLAQAREAGLGTPREEAYVEALATYYAPGPQAAETERLTAYAQAWAEVRDAYPTDPEATLFAGLSMNAAARGPDRPATLAEAGGLAEQVLSAIPDHPGAHHYIIHAYDSPALAERALPTARSYGKVAPENAHALHMTSHIFTRVGSWNESIDYNQRSADAAAKHPINGAVSHHHLHAVDYLAYAYLQTGQDAEAEQVLAHLVAMDGPVVDNPVSAYAFAAVPARIALEHHDWERAAVVEARWPANLNWDRYPHLVAIPVFARALGAAHLGDLETAHAAAAELDELALQAEDLPDAYDWATQVRIQEIGARAWVAYAEGRTDEAVALMSEATDLEVTTSKNPVTPGEVLPATELLGDMLLELGRYDDALRAYERTLERSPNRANAVRGAAHAAEGAGDAQAAAHYQELLHAIQPHGTAVQGP
jgi:tetratricopeptide (TPR) repeat protein